jgi:hypothetical protein
MMRSYRRGRVAWLFQEALRRYFGEPVYEPTDEERRPVRKVAVTLPEELFDMVERLREIEHRSRSEVRWRRTPSRCRAVSWRSSQTR